nr:MAG: N-acetylmuramoyl-L-alanine amidase [Bacteriophage sp.]
MDNITWIGSPNHYQGRNGHAITHITLHIMVGHLTGTDNVFQHPGGASAHYGIGADGTIHQYVNEKDGSWSDANYTSNNSTISIEHEGGMNGIPCTQNCMDASARLCADIARRQGWTHLWHDGLKGNIWLHREIPGTDHYGCPDHAPNSLDVTYVINKANQLLQGDNMTPEDVWNFDQNGIKMRDRMQGTDTAANETRTELFRLTQWDENTHASALGNLVIEQPIQEGAKLGDRIAGIDNKTSQLTTQIAALTKTIKTLTTAINNR